MSQGELVLVQANAAVKGPLQKPGNAVLELGLGRPSGRTDECRLIH